jgi:hypothetical protein
MAAAEGRWPVHIPVHQACIPVSQPHPPQWLRVREEALQIGGGGGTSPHCSSRLRRGQTGSFRPLAKNNGTEKVIPGNRRESCLCQQTADGGWPGCWAKLLLLQLSTGGRSWRPRTPPNSTALSPKALHAMNFLEPLTRSGGGQGGKGDMCSQPGGVKTPLPS